MSDECNVNYRFPLFEISYTHNDRIYSAHIGAKDWKDAVEKLASLKSNGRITGSHCEIIEPSEKDSE